MIRPLLILGVSVFSLAGTPAQALQTILYTTPGDYVFTATANAVYKILISGAVGGAGGSGGAGGAGGHGGTGGTGHFYDEASDSDFPVYGGVGQKGSAGAVGAAGTPGRTGGAQYAELTLSKNEFLYLHVGAAGTKGSNGAQGAAGLPGQSADTCISRCNSYSAGGGGAEGLGGRGGAGGFNGGGGGATFVYGDNVEDDGYLVFAVGGDSGSGGAGGRGGNGGAGGKGGSVSTAVAGYGALPPQSVVTSQPGASGPGGTQGKDGHTYRSTYSEPGTQFWTQYTDAVGGAGGAGGPGGLGTAGGYEGGFNPGEYSHGETGGAGFANAFVSITENTPAAVPEPTTWAMMLAGFGFVGGALRRRVSVLTG